jgi:predicted acyl esterase
MDVVSSFVKAKLQFQSKTQKLDVAAFLVDVRPSGLLMRASYLKCGSSGQGCDQRRGFGP